MASAQKMVPLGDEDLVLDLEDEETAALRGDLAPVVGTIQKSGYQVRIRRQHEVNGLFEPHLSQEATLLVLKFQLKADDPNDRITFFSVSLIFDSAPDADDDDDPPYLVSFAPAQEGAISLEEHQTTVTRTHEFKVTGSGQAPLNVASLNLEGSRSTQREYTQQDKYVLQTQTSRDPMTLSEENVVCWEMNAASTPEGVGDSITVAVLLRRARSSRFSISLEAHAHVGSIANAVEKVKDLLDVRKKKKYKTLGRFGPAKGAKQVPGGQTVPEGIDPSNLYSCSTCSRYAALRGPKTPTSSGWSL
ncbi:hypothetical protein A1O1_04955 [Capronia coronata CBS 617.96]|uniref:Uncharacterized protein n=1 Tax=Capronia coronata CBS 617.96 TaxID=1182541 RepID=W9Y670_9EURO|nr:uncharacterized protein A1O1_04955 [Capronia coronata CBS 617.96]EXJ88028.1 hypothetical protein A1O1_04955 [Capronia coronata CBS 617.96]